MRAISKNDMILIHDVTFSSNVNLKECWEFCQENPPWDSVVVMHKWYCLKWNYAHMVCFHQKNSQIKLKTSENYTMPEKNLEYVVRLFQTMFVHFLNKFVGIISHILNSLILWTFQPIVNENTRYFRSKQARRSPIILYINHQSTTLTTKKNYLNVNDFIKKKCMGFYSAWTAGPRCINTLISYFHLKRQWDRLHQVT